MSLGFAGSQLLKFYSRLSQTLGNTRSGQGREITEGADTPKPQCFPDLIRNFFLDVNQRMIESSQEEVSKTSQLLARGNEGYAFEISGRMDRRVRIRRQGYVDGSFGDPMLIFPTLKTRGGDNRVMPGKLIDIPAQEDQYSYFTAQPAGSRRDQVAEVLTVILTPSPLPVTIGDQPLKVLQSQISDWEKLWGGLTETLELIGGAGRTWTNEEKLASAANGRQLTQGGPPPQTVYRVVARKTGGPLMVTVPLRYAR